MAAPPVPLTAAAESPIAIDVYADVAHPWCWIGERRLARALALRCNLVVERRWRPFQLEPQLPPEGMPWPEFVERRLGGPERARGLFASIVAAGVPEGLHFDFAGIARAPNTVDAHRLILHAARLGREWTVADALFRAYFAEGRDLGDRAQLVAVAAGAGMDAADAARLLDGDDEREPVLESQRAAARLGVRGVPFVLLDCRIVVSGAQPTGIFVEALDEARRGLAHR